MTGAALTKAQAAQHARWPVEPGQRWAVGPHRLACLDWQEADMVGWLLEQAGGPVALCWTDPPWDPSIHRTFRRQAGARPVEGLDPLFEKLGQALAFVDGAALVWTGKRARELARGAVASARFTSASEHWVTYDQVVSPVPVQVGWRGSPRLGPPPLDDLRGGPAIAPAFVRWALAEGLATEGDALLDPFVGQGVAARAAAEHGLRLVAAELHPGRAAVTLGLLRRLSGEAPELLG